MDVPGITVVTDDVERTVGRVLARAAAAWPERPYVHVRRRPWTFEETRQRAERARDGFAQLGIGHGDQVAVLLGSRPEVLLTWLG